MCLNADQYGTLSWIWAYLAVSLLERCDVMRYAHPCMYFAWVPVKVLFFATHLGGEGSFSLSFGSHSPHPTTRSPVVSHPNPSMYRVRTSPNFTWLVCNSDIVRRIQTVKNWLSCPRQTRQYDRKSTPRLQPFQNGSWYSSGVPRGKERRRLSFRPGKSRPRCRNRLHTILQSYAGYSSRVLVAGFARGRMCATNALVAGLSKVKI